ncbi:MAG: phosphate/phosphite/phosphonate ABC transporter substrate-binding protein, partial [Pseudomonadales bacterium]
LLHGQNLTLGIVPQQSAKVLAQRWTPISQYLSEQTGFHISFKTAKDIPTFERRLLAGEYDLAYMNPYHYTVFSQRPGYLPLARERDKRIKGIVVVKRDSDITDISQLRAQTLAFPAPAAFAASVIPRAKMRDDALDITPKYVSSHDSVYLGVAKGFFPAGGGVKRTFNNAPAAVRDQLRILWTTPGYTPHALAAHPRVDEAARAKVLAALLGMHNSERGRALLQSVKFKQLSAAQDSDWDDVRQLNITLLDHLLNAPEEQ